MHISKLSLVNYRNFANAKLLFNKGINTIIGENGSGKTNLFRAMRLLLDENMRRSATRLKEADFHRGLSTWKGHWIIISMEFNDVSQDEAIQSLFLHGTGNLDTPAIEKATYNLIFRPKTSIRIRLSELDDGDHEGLADILCGITLADYETVFTGKSEADFNDPDLYKRIAGDFEAAKFSEEIEFPEIGARLPNILTISQEVSFTYVQALRDVIADFQNNRTNPLLTLLKSKSGEIAPGDFLPIAEMVGELNGAIEALPDVQTLRTDISTTINETAGETYSPARLSIKSDLSDDADKLFQSLKLFVGETDEAYEGAIHELSLGGANLIYLTLKLLEFKYQKEKQSFANFLLIEEPEAHIHTHIQKTLFDKLNYADTQIVYSTHSTHISEVSNVRNINILAKREARCDSYQPANNLTPDDIGNIQRYLDAVRSNLLFAKSVVLVEGDAEEILIPILIKKVLGLSLDELGISLVNIRSTGFKNVAILFHNDRIKKRCAIITDLDKAILDTTPANGDSEDLASFKKKCKGSQEAGVTRKSDLELFSAGNAWIKLCLAPHTFEVDFVGAGNVATVVSVVGEIYISPPTIATAKTDLESNLVGRYGRRVLTMAAKDGKGWFAIRLGGKVDFRTVIPDYILDAIFFAKPDVSNDVWFQILAYRVRCIEEGNHATPEAIAAFRTKLEEFKREVIDFVAIRNEMLASFTADQINPILNRF